MDWLSYLAFGTVMGDVAKKVECSTLDPTFPTRNPIPNQDLNKFDWKQYLTHGVPKLTKLEILKNAKAKKMAEKLALVRLKEQRLREERAANRVKQEAETQKKVVLIKEKYANLISEEQEKLRIEEEGFKVSLASLESERSRLQELNAHVENLKKQHLDELKRRREEYEKELAELDRLEKADTNDLVSDTEFVLLIVAAMVRAVEQQQALDENGTDGYGDGDGNGDTPLADGCCSLLQTTRIPSVEDSEGDKILQHNETMMLQDQEVVA